MVLLPRKYLKDYLHRLIQNFHGCNRKGAGNMGGSYVFLVVPGEVYGIRTELVLCRLA